MIGGDLEWKDYLILHNLQPIKPNRGSLFSFFVSLYTARPSCEYYRQVYLVHSGLQDESLQVTISKLPLGSLTAQGVTFPAQGTSS